MGGKIGRISAWMMEGRRLDRDGMDGRHAPSKSEAARVTAVSTPGWQGSYVIVRPSQLQHTPPLHHLNRSPVLHIPTRRLRYQISFRILRCL